MSKKIWTTDRTGKGDPPYLPNEREELARNAWMAAAEYLKPELFTTVNDRLPEINVIFQAFESWWRLGGEYDQCRYTIADEDGYLHCTLEKGHDAEHQAHRGAKNGLWFMPEPEPEPEPTT